MSKTRLRLEDMKILLTESVKIKNRGQVEDILNKLREGGKEKLQVIADFDRTLTRPHCNGVECLSSYGIFNLCPSLPPSFVKHSEELYKMYRPLEMDPTLSIEEKSIQMENWISKKENILNFDLDRKEINIAVEKARVALRDETDVMLKTLSDANVPVLVFSAGLGDTVQGVLQYEKVMHPNMHVISNFLKFDGNKVLGFQGEMIHTFNKNERALRNTSYFNELVGKQNVILLGDALGDAGMADGVKDINAVLKIGFLEDRIEDNLETYMNHFDIVLVDDQSMKLVNELLGEILESPLFHK